MQQKILLDMIACKIPNYSQLLLGWEFSAALKNTWKNTLTLSSSDNVMYVWSTVILIWKGNKIGNERSVPGKYYCKSVSKNKDTSFYTNVR